MTDLSEEIGYWRRLLGLRITTGDEEMKWTEGGSGEIEKAPAGSHLARCCAVIDLGTQTTNWEGHEKKVRQVRLSWELVYTKMLGTYNAELAGMPFIVHRVVTQSLNEKATLRRLLQGWRGKEFTSAEVEAFEPRSLIGAPCRLSLIVNRRGFADVDSISPATREEKDAMPQLKTKAHYFSLDEFDQQEWEGLSNWVQRKIMATPEWAELHGGEERTEEPEPEVAVPPEEYDYDNIPF